MCAKLNIYMAEMHTAMRKAALFDTAGTEAINASKSSDIFPTNIHLSRYVPIN